MCGIAGLLTAGKIDADLLERMGASVAHRGPDDDGVWIDADAGIGFAHRRLAIVDLSPFGHQPMHSADGRFVLSYNGEIYNHAELRRELDRAGETPAGGWRGHSDTETLLQCIAVRGLSAALGQAVGMFAFALWDRTDRALSLVRDRFGEKPLYYGWAGPDFVFGSELKALRMHPRFDNDIDRRALGLFAARNYIPAPRSIYRRIFKLEPGCILTVTPEGARMPLDDPPRPGAGARGISLDRYWSYCEVVQRGFADPVADEAEALERLEAVLAEAVMGQSIADVPVGAFLSGGVDSSAVVAIYQKYAALPVRTFTIGFEEAGFNEAEHARRVAQHFGTDHHERIVTAREAQDVIPDLARMYDEPFADSSQIPTYLVSRFAREQVKVALSGDGGDELFGGYNRYFGTARAWTQLNKLPAPARSLIGGALAQLPPGLWNGLGRVAGGGRQMPEFGAKVRKSLRSIAGANGLDDLFTGFLDEWAGEPSPVIGAVEGGSLCAFDLDLGGAAPDAMRMMYCDAVTYLPDDILCKVDRAAMAVSLETRVPFLDHRVAELAARIPIEMKIRGMSGKHILKRLLYQHAPRELFERPKAGFGIPVGQWLKGPLRPWAEDLLDPARMAAKGFFDPAIVGRRWRDHVAGRRDSTAALWGVLMFQAWLRDSAMVERSTAPPPSLAPALGTA